MSDETTGTSTATTEAQAPSHPVSSAQDLSDEEMATVSGGLAQGGASGLPPVTGAQNLIEHALEHIEKALTGKPNG